MIPGSANPLLLAGAAEEAGYAIERSLRFNSADSAYLSRTPSTAGNRKTWTWAGWVKLSKLGTTRRFWGVAGSSDTTLVDCRFELTDKIQIAVSSTQWRTTTQVFRDCSSFYHIVIAVDTTLTTANDRVKLYVNGSQVTNFDTTNNPSQNADTGINQTAVHRIGAGYVASNYLDAYLADVHFIDGQALDPTSFGEFDADTGIWNPIEASFTSPNNNITWSANVSASTGSIVDAALAFNGSTTSGDAYASSTASDTYIYIDFATALSGTFKLWTGMSSGSPTATVTHSGGSTVVNLSSGENTLGAFTSVTRIAVNRGEAATHSFRAVAVDGIVLIDGATKWGTNGFHLPFSDNSSAAALGDDTSGNNNDWTVNNISVLQGTGSYVSGWSGSLASGYPGSNAFDGSTATLAISAASASATWTAPSAISFTTLRIFGQHDNGTISVNGTNVTSQFPSTPGSWVTLTGISSPLSTVVLTSSGTSQPRIAAIEIDGVVLVDYRFGSGTDSLIDVPTNGTETDSGLGAEVRGNYATINSAANAGLILSNGNLDFTGTGNVVKSAIATVGASSGKWYFEGTIAQASSGGNLGFGIQNQTFNAPSGTQPHNNSYGWVAITSGSNTTFYKAHNGTFTGIGTYAGGDVIGIAVDIDAGKIWFAKNGTWFGSGDPVAGTNAAYTNFTGPMIPYAYGYNTNDIGTLNFGQRPFAYTAPSGFKALCTANLPAPTVEDGSTAMDVVTYTGNGTGQSITSLNFSPDLVWIKSRSAAYSHNLYDVIRGADKALFSDTTNAETTYNGRLTSFDTTGFTLGNTSTAGVGTNENNTTYAAWTWDAGSSTVSNTDGSITSSVRANPTAGFSIVTYTGNGTANQTIGHGLGVTPDFVISKSRTASYTYTRWYVYHKDLATNYHLLLDTTNGQVNGNGNYYVDNLFSSTVFGVGSDIYGPNVSGDDYVAYCFAAVEGYSAFGSYTGNGSSDGPFVFTGFRPAFVMWKQTNSARNWPIMDSTRDTFNEVDQMVWADLSNAESTVTTDDVDFLSNGFKMRGAGVTTNQSGGTYIYMAFAENPFALNARAR